MANEKILIADGNVAFTEMLKTRLQERGYLVSCASRHREALDILNAEWIDLVVSSIVLKGSANGFELFKDIKKKRAFQDIPVIIQSSKAAMKKTLKLMGVDAFFIKPYPIDLFLDEVRDILAKKILVLGNKKLIVKSIVRVLDKYDYHIDVVNNHSRFYSLLAQNRYSLIVIQYDIKHQLADRPVLLARGVSKNRNTPIIIYMPGKKSDLSRKSAREVGSIKEWSGKMGPCYFIDRTFSRKMFVERVSKYLCI